MSKLNKKLTSLAIVMLSIASFFSPVSVSAADCPNPGPYGICPPDTGIILTNEATTISNGDLYLNNAVAVILFAVLFAGIVLVFNGIMLKRRTSRKGNR